MQNERRKWQTAIDVLVLLGAVLGLAAWVAAGVYLWMDGREFFAAMVAAVLLGGVGLAWRSRPRASPSS